MICRLDPLSNWSGHDGIRRKGAAIGDGLTGSRLDTWR
jgi:hypothetical protein